MAQCLDEKMLMPWHQHHGILNIITVIFYCNPALLSSPTEEDRDRIYGWTLDTGQPPDDISDAAAAHTAAIQLRSSCSSDTSRASFWQKVLPIFFNISMGAVSVPAFPIINTASKAHPLYFESPTSRKLCNLA